MWFSAKRSEKSCSEQNVALKSMASLHPKYFLQAPTIEIDMVTGTPSDIVWEKPVPLVTIATYY